MGCTHGQKKIQSGCMCFGRRLMGGVSQWCLTQQVASFLVAFLTFLNVNSCSFQFFSKPQTPLANLFLLEICTFFVFLNHSCSIQKELMMTDHLASTGAAQLPKAESLSSGWQLSRGTLTQSHILKTREAGTLVHICNSRTWESEARRS